MKGRQLAKRTLKQSTSPIQKTKRKPFAQMNPLQQDLLILAGKGRYPNIHLARALGEKHNVKAPSVWMATARLKETHPEMFPDPKALGRKKRIAVSMPLHSNPAVHYLPENIHSSSHHIHEGSCAHDLLEGVKAGHFLNKSWASQLAEKHKVHINSVWRVYAKLRKSHAKLFPKKEGLGRKTLTEVVKHRGELEQLLLSTKGQKEIRLPTSRLSQLWSLSGVTITGEAKRVRAKLISEGHNLGKFARGGKEWQRVKIPKAWLSAKKKK